MRRLSYRIVDVFTERPLEGNALAVFVDGQGLDEPTMQRIARELNLSETTFVLPPRSADCAARVRIFTPHRELPFAGHPSIGTAWVLLDEGMPTGDTENFGLEEGIGTVSIRVEHAEPPLIWLRTPAISDGSRIDAASCAAALGIGEGDLLPFAPQILSAGNPTLLVPVRDPGVVDRAHIGAEAARRLTRAQDGGACVFVFAPTSRGAYSRMFAPHLGIAEDPATGSSTGPLAAYMMRHGMIGSGDGVRFVSEQGVKMRRRSELHVAIVGNDAAAGIDVGGCVVGVGRGELVL